MPGKVNIRHPDDIAKSLYIHPSNHATSHVVSIIDREFVLGEYRRLWKMVKESQKLYSKTDGGRDYNYWKRLGEILNG